MTRRSEMLTAGIQTVALTALQMIIYHEMSRSAADSIWEDPSVRNLTVIFTHMNMSASQKSNASAAAWANLPTGLNLTHPADINTSSLPNPLLDGTEKFYWPGLPRHLLVVVMLFPLAYYWHVNLESAFLTRPRGVEIAYEREKEKKDFDHDLNVIREEEVVKRWIAQGKVRRSSVSWWNTFVKWILNITIGSLWYIAAVHVLKGVLKWESFAVIFGGLRSATVYAFIGSFFSILPLASLISFVIVPARKRVVFEAGVGTAEAVFASAFIRLVIPWAVQTRLVQGMLANSAEKLLKSFLAKDQAAGMEGRLIGEL